MGMSTLKSHLLSLPRDARLMWLGAGAVGASDASRSDSFQTFPPMAVKEHLRQPVETASKNRSIPNPLLNLSADPLS
jgi:hypothetical protein